MRKALAEAQGFGDADDLALDDLQLGSEDEDGSDIDGLSEASTPKTSSSGLKHDNIVSHATEPLEGAGVTRRSYQESSAPPEGCGGYQTGEFVPPQVG